MGLFDIFKGKVTPGQTKPIAAKGSAPLRESHPLVSVRHQRTSGPHGVKAEAMPTVKPGPELFAAFDEVFLREMRTISAFNEHEVKAMLQCITQGDGGYLNQGRYHKHVFEIFFRGRDWSWPWFERWDAIYAGLGEYPAFWTPCNQPERQIGPVDVIPRLTVADAKELLTSAGVSFPDKVKMANLVELSLATPESIRAIAAAPMWQAKREKVFHPPGFPMYGLFIRTVVFRAKSLADRKRQRELGVTDWKLGLGHPEHQRFVDLALSQDPEALPPFFPGDTSYWRPNLAAPAL